MESAAVPVAQPSAVVVDPTAPGAKGLKANALGYASNLVIAVASTAPGIQPGGDAGVHRARQRIGVHAPAVMIVSFIPILFVSVGYRFLNLADPDAGTTFAWVTRALGPWLGWVKRLGDRPGRRDRDGIAGRDREHVHILALERHPIDLRPDHGRGDLDRRDDVDLLPRDRALRPDPAVPAQPGDLHADPVRDRRAGQGLLKQPVALDPRLGLVVQPIRPELDFADRRRPAGHLHLLGVGLGRGGQRGVQGSGIAVPERQPSCPRSCCWRSTFWSRRRPVLPRAGFPGRATPTMS